MQIFLAALALVAVLSPSIAPGGDSNAHAGAPVAVGSTPVLEVLFPPASSQREFQDVQTYLLDKASPAFPLIAGAVIRADWSDFDIGDAKTGTHTRYDFKIVDEAIAPWIAAGKFANIVLHTTPYGGNQCPSSGSGSNGVQGIGNCAMPPWMWTALGEANFTNCANAQVPNFISSVYIKNYQAAMAALIEHYASNPGVGYIRIGLGKGGEINLPRGWYDTTEACGQAYITRWGYTVGDSNKYTWNAYLEKMLDYEGSLHAVRQLMVSVTPVQSPSGNPQDVSEFMVPVAVKNGIGFGTQGLSQPSLHNCSGQQADWCALFERFQGKVPLEVQTLGPSCPQGSCGNQGRGQGQSRGQGRWAGGQGQGPWQRQGQGQSQGRWTQGSQPASGAALMANLSGMTGSLVPLLPFAVKSHATIIEIYCEDWLLAFSPNHPHNKEYGAEYVQAMRQVTGK
jgi:hypothetical protein